MNEETQDPMTDNSLPDAEGNTIRTKNVVLPLSAFNDSGRTKDRGVECEFCSGFETKLRARHEKTGAEPGIKLQTDGQTPPISPQAEHDLISKIAEFLGTSPAELGRAEDLIEKFKYDIAKFVLLEEYNLENPISLSTALWLEARTNPEKIDQIQETAKTYLS